MSTSPRLVVELVPYFVRAAVVVGQRVVAHGEFAANDAAGVAAFVSEHAAGAPLWVTLLYPASEIAALVPADEAATLSTADACLARAAGGAGAQVAVCDVAKGLAPKGDGAAAVLLAGITAVEEAEARGRLDALGLSSESLAPALPAELGAVVRLLGGRPASESIAVWVPGELAGKLWIVAASGIRAVRYVPAGFAQIFEVVQAELGLKFRAAASKLFLNGQYDFGEKAERIGGRLGADLLAALDQETPVALHVVGLNAGQAWLAAAVAKSLELPVWTPTSATACFGISAERASTQVIGLLQAAAANQVGGEWLPACLKPGAALPGVAAKVDAPASADPSPMRVARAPAPVSKPAATSAPVKPAPVNKPAAVKPVAPVPAPAAAKAAMPAAKPAAMPAAKPAVKPAVKPAEKPAEKPAPAPATAPVQAKKFPLVPVIAGVVGLVLIGGGTMFFLKPSAKTAKTTPATASVSEAKPATAAAVSGAPDLNLALQRAVLETELKRDPLSFRNDNYAFRVSSKGVLMDLKATEGTSAWIENLGFMRLYGVTFGADGRRVVRKAGDMSSPEYQARVVKGLRDGAIVFDVDVTHPKYLLAQTYICLPNSVKVNVRFKPARLSDNSGPLDAIYGVHLGSKEITAPGATPVMRKGEVVYGTKSGVLSLRYDPAFTGAGSKPVVGDPELVSFVLAVNGGTTEQVLSYEIVLP